MPDRGVITKEERDYLVAIYDALKDAIDIAQKAQNAELLQKLFDAQKQALELQKENAGLNELIKKMQDISALEEKVERYNDKYYITFSDDPQKIEYCSTCWDSDRKKIQIYRGVYCKICPKR